MLIWSESIHPLSQYLQQTYLYCELACHHYCFALNNEIVKLSPRNLFIRLVLIMEVLLLFFPLVYNRSHSWIYFGKQRILHLFRNGLEFLWLDLFFDAWNDHLYMKLSSEQYIKPHYLLKNGISREISNLKATINIYLKFILRLNSCSFIQNYYPCLISGLEV